MTINKAKEGITTGKSEPASRAVMNPKESPKPANGKKPPELEQSIWPGGIDKFHEGA
jgi:hypothetical protein